MSFPAIPVKLHDFLRRQGRFVPPHLGEPGEHIGVLHIKLKLVDFIAAQAVNHFLQVCHLRHPPSGHVQIIAPVLYIRPVLNQNAFRRASLLLDYLAERLCAVQNARFVPACYKNPVFLNFQPVFLRGQTAPLTVFSPAFPVKAKENIPLFGRSRCNRGRKSRPVFHAFL